MILTTVYNNEQELLKSIISLHAPSGIELDPMFFKGNFYKEIPRPKYIFDIDPKNPDCQKADARSLPLDDGIINCMILDPPFLFEIRNRINSNYSVNTHGIMKGFDGMESLYKEILR